MRNFLLLLFVKKAVFHGSVEKKIVTPLNCKKWIFDSFLNHTRNAQFSTRLSGMKKGPFHARVEKKLFNLSRWRTLGPRK